MKLFLLPIFMITNSCYCQGWEAEIGAGVSGYSGDLTQQVIPVKTFKPGITINLKYNVDNTIVLRGGISWLNVQGNDRHNKQPDLKARNLDFKTSIWEATVGAEVNLVEPELFSGYPYLFAAVGLFHFNPYTFDKDNKKTYLQPFGTEGQGIAGRPKPYSLTQICLPLGGGWKMNINKRYDIIYEFSYRLLFTDYLDDVSTTYVNSETLAANNGSKSAELAYRQLPLPDSDLPRDGDTRGNPKVKDGYFFSGIKFLVHLGKD